MVGVVVRDSWVCLGVLLVLMVVFSLFMHAYGSVSYSYFGCG